MFLILSPPVMFVYTEDSCHSQHTGAEKAFDGLGYFYEDSGLFFHGDLLWSSVQRGKDPVEISLRRPL